VCCQYLVFNGFYNLTDLVTLILVISNKDLEQLLPDVVARRVPSCWELRSLIILALVSVFPLLWRKEIRRVKYFCFLSHRKIQLQKYKLN